MKTILWSISLLSILPVNASAGKVHLFLLSGQSNMAGLKPEHSFTPAVKKALAGDQVIVVKDAASGQPILRWHKAWVDAKGEGADNRGDLYARLMSKVNPAVGDQKIDTVTFVWMQGERDAKEGHGSVYAKSMKGLIDQVRTRFKGTTVNVVIGRLSDFGNGNKRYQNWDDVRKAQVDVAEADPNAVWIDTDDWNGPKNGLHYSKEGYVKLGEAFATAAVKMIKK